MKTIKETVNTNIEINKSNFISYLYPVESTEEIKDILSNLKQKYPDATHHVSAYILGKNAEIGHLNDDHEPSGTAASPIMEVLKKNNLSNVLCVVIRYFGGIKLGAGGLIRAYSQSAAKALEIAEVIDIVTYDTLTIKFQYNLYDLILKHLNNVEIISSDFKETITLNIKFNILIKDELINDLINITNNRIIIEK